MSGESSRAILSEAVRLIGGQERPGQVEMAAAVEHAFATGEHLLVQAGTGTGKSLGYLAPALALVLDDPGERVVVATATLALQRQLATKDIPVVLEAAEAVAGRRPRVAVLKGRSNHVCLYRIRDQVGADQATLVGGAEVADALRAAGDAPDSLVGAEVVSLREWAEEELEAGGLADRDDAPTHGARAWAQVSVPARECLGTAACPYGGECFVEASRAEARAADIVVTNHALLAIDALHGGTALPEHGFVVIDEAHELVSRVTGAASEELSPALVDRVAKRAMAWLDDEVGLDLLESGDALRDALDEAPLERVTDPDSGVVAALASVRQAARAAFSQVSKDSGADPARQQAAAAVQEVAEIADRMAGLAQADVVWVADRERAGRHVLVAPLSVAGLLRAGVLAQRSAVLTSATLRIGGDFDAAASAVGLLRSERLRGDASGGTEGQGDGDGLTWRGLDVGSPFDYRGQGILYVARHLPPPQRDATGDDVLAEIAQLVWAAGGRTLGLFASQRSAEAAAAYVRRELPNLPVLCQGDAQLSELTRRFADDPQTSLFGTLSLWQGVDVPGETCRLVLIDKLPFPRPDEPLQLARQLAVTQAGGNGFMEVAASHAALLLAQGAGRLIRRLDDRGVVAVLDPRLVTARYGSYLRASLPDFWMTTDREVAVGALRRLDGEV